MERDNSEDNEPHEVVHFRLTLVGGDMIRARTHDFSSIGIACTTALRVHGVLCSLH